MTGINASGLGSGLDVNSIVSQLMAVERQPLTVLASKEASFQAKLSAYGTLKGALSSLQTAVQALKSPGTFTGKSATVSDSTVLSATATSSAANGTHSISVTQLAKFHSVRSNTNYAATTDTFHTGTLSIKIGSGTPVDIAIDGTNNTLGGIRDAINTARTGVTASIINDGTTNRLVLASKTTGSAGAITVAVTDAGSGGTHALTGLASASLVTVQAADDANLTINGLSISRSSNTISDAIEGVTLKLVKGTLASPGTATVAVAQNTSTVTAAVGAFVKAYNEVISGIKTMTAYDAANKKASVLTGDSTARSIQSQLSNLVQSGVGGIEGGIARLSDIGITVQKDGTLATDSNKLAAAHVAPDKDIAALFTQTTSGNEGIAVRLGTLVDNLVGVTGPIASRTDGIKASIKDLGKRSEALNFRLAAVEKRYRAQFTALDTLVASMNQTSNYLTQQLANLPGAASSR